MIKALGKRLIVEEVKLQPKKESLLILPDDKTNITAVVLAFGGEVDKGIDLGDIVYLLHDTGIPISINGVEYLSIVENQIIAAWKDK